MLSDVFEKTAAEDRAAFIGYLPAGYPTVEDSVKHITTLGKYADIVEVGIPFSDPMMDGPVIQDAATVALENGFRVEDVIDVVRQATESGVTCVVMTYWNPVLQYGPEKFAQDLAQAGGRGAIIPDLLPEEAHRWTEYAQRSGLDPIYLVAPSSTDARLELTTHAGSGFIYAASHMGVTGTQESVSVDAEDLVNRVREYTDLPVGVGLGVSNGLQAHMIAQYADAVIVGSALIKAVVQGDNSLEKLSAELAKSVLRK